jgi:hypothetical protein
MDRAVWSNVEKGIESHTLAKKKNESNRSCGTSGQSGLSKPFFRFQGYTQLDTYSVGFLCVSHQLVAEAANYTTQRKQKWRTGFEPAFPAIERHKTYVLDRTATGIGDCLILEEGVGITVLSWCILERDINSDTSRICGYCCPVTKNPSGIWALIWRT